MIVNKLEIMESIVKKNRNLFWDGWNVIDLKRSDIARTSSAGIRINGQWYLHKVYAVDHNGWDIPNKYKE
jgi:plasmid maintenance system killer protein